MTIDLKAIRAAAEAAPQDRLHVRHDFGAYYSLRHYPGDYYQGRIRGKERAEYIATANPAAILELLDRLEAAEKDAARYRWLKANHQTWSWQPSRYNSEIISGFACNNTGYSGFAFEEALTLAMKEQK